MVSLKLFLGRKVSLANRVDSADLPLHSSAAVLMAARLMEVRRTEERMALPRTAAVACSAQPARLLVHFWATSLTAAPARTALRTAAVV